MLCYAGAAYVSLGVGLEFETVPAICENGGSLGGMGKGVAVDTGGVRLMRSLASWETSASVLPK